MTARAAIQKARELADKATPGPWLTPEQAGDPYDRRVPVDHEGCQVWPWGSADDMKLAYAARQLVPLLLDVAEAAAEMEKWLDRYAPVPRPASRGSLVRHRLHAALSVFTEAMQQEDQK